MPTSGWNMCPATCEPPKRWSCVLQPQHSVQLGSACRSLSSSALGAVLKSVVMYLSLSEMSRGTSGCAFGSRALVYQHLWQVKQLCTCGSSSASAPCGWCTWQMAVLEVIPAAASPYSVGTHGGGSGCSSGLGPPHPTRESAGTRPLPLQQVFMICCAVHTARARGHMGRGVLPAGPCYRLSPGQPTARWLLVQVQESQAGVRARPRLPFRCVCLSGLRLVCFSAAAAWIVCRLPTT
jgi:hypothetical protein